LPGWWSAILPNETCWLAIKPLTILTKVLNRLKGLPCNFEGCRFFNPDSIFLRILDIFNSRYDTIWRLFCQINNHIYFLIIKVSVYKMIL
jgi:hypothetical protein